MRRPHRLVLLLTAAALGATTACSSRPIYTDTTERQPSPVLTVGAETGISPAQPEQDPTTSPAPETDASGPHGGAAEVHTGEQVELPDDFPDGAVALPGGTVLTASYAEGSPGERMWSLVFTDDETTYDKAACDRYLDALVGAGLEESVRTPGPDEVSAHLSSASLDVTVACGPAAAGVMLSVSERG